MWREVWPRFRPAEMAFTGGMAINVAMALFLYPAPKNNWDGPILFDKPIRNTVTLKDRDARNVAASVSDGIYYALAGFPIIDTVVVASAVHSNSDLTVQMLAIDLESFAFGGAIAMSAEKAGRRRPMARVCESDPSYDKKCKNDDNLNSSFLSGHTTIGFVGAGLLCAHHLNVPLYGGGAADTTTCIAGMSAAIVGGALRVTTDNHYTSDVVLDVAETRSNLAAVLVRQKRFAEALVVVREAVKQFPSFKPLYTNGYLAAVGAGDEAQAEELAARGREIIDDDPIFLVARGVSDYERGRFAQAARSFERARSDKSDSVVIHAWLVRAYVAAGDARNGAQAFERAWILAPNDPRLARLAEEHPELKPAR